MGGMIDLFQQISTSVKLGWIVCLVWAVVQILWYRRLSADQIEVMPTSRFARIFRSPR